MQSSIDILAARPLDRDAIARLYAEAGYGAVPGADDTVIVAKLGATLVGVARLCPEEGVTVLRGMQVSKAFQGQGIGARLLAACVPHMAQSDTFCLPYTHLEHFYAAAGFAPIHGAGLPGFLAQRLAAYRGRGQDVMAMRRPAA
ncbi:GNAT family N-acetyltransferase [Massilia agri]|uniref:GNAT family N-acetyltransferase n=1 Tax=Massilia agri TaxID=1886785 RepID=A0ABT2ARW9_9BURK|nr:GNAT family N-acetyltransferase [Massilia agri]MCS0598680.1 GNAT family N-acetyltransferase [Massilia agri]